MNDPNIFNALIQTTLGVAQVRVRQAIYEFVNTYSALLTVADDDIDNFVKMAHAANSGRAAAAKVLIPSSVVVALKAILFELKDRELCASLPDEHVLEGITLDQLRIMRSNRNKAMEMIEIRKNQSYPDMVVPTLTSTNFEEFDLAFTGAARRQFGLAGISLDYLLRQEDEGNYNSPWETREEQLKMCAAFQGQKFKEDSGALYDLLVQHVGTTGTGSNIITRHKSSKNGRKCYVELKGHFKTASYEETKARSAEKKISDANYFGERRNFNIETYYDVFAKAFNDLDDAGGVYKLSEEQKINKFESGLREEKAINYSITARNEWKSLAHPNKSFEDYYTIFSASLTKHNALSNQNNGKNRSFARISEMSSRGGRGGRGRFRGGQNNRGRGRGRGRRAGRGRGRFTSYNPYHFASTHGPFVAEARIYPSDEWKYLSNDQKQAVQAKKIEAGWSDGNTPPPGFRLDESGRAVPNMSMVAALSASIREVSTSNNTIPSTSLVALPPAPTNYVPPIPPIVTTNAQSAGQTFGRQGTRVRPSDTSTIASVTINGRRHEGPVFDINGNPVV